MSRNVYLFTFKERVSIQEVQDTLFLSMFASEGIHGRTRVRLEANFIVDDRLHACVVDGATAVGVTIAQIFTGLLAREIGEDVFKVCRVVDPPPCRDGKRGEQLAN